VLPRQFYLITRRCTQRQFLLRPDGPTNNAFLYCQIDAALRCDIDVLLPCAMSNHYHVVIYDRAGRYPEFIEHFHKLLLEARTPCAAGEKLLVVRADLRRQAGRSRSGSRQAAVHRDQPSA
jgi:hypothetical protein